MSGTTCYQKNREAMLSRANEYYENNKEVFREKSKNKYRKLSGEEKNIKRKYGRNRYRNLSEEITIIIVVVVVVIIIIIIIIIIKKYLSSLSDSLSDSSDELGSKPSLIMFSILFFFISYLQAPRSV